MATSKKKATGGGASPPGKIPTDHQFSIVEANCLGKVVSRNPELKKAFQRKKFRSIMALQLDALDHEYGKALLIDDQGEARWVALKEMIFQ